MAGLCSPEAYPIMKSKYTNRNLKMSLRRIYNTEEETFGKALKLCSTLFDCSSFNLLDHDAVGASELQASGEVKSVHPAQHQSKHHHRDICLNARQVQSSCDDYQDRVDEAKENRGEFDQ